MKSLADRKKEILDFWHVDDAAKEKLLIELRAYTQSQDADAFADEVRATFQQYIYSGIEVIYEALSTNPEKWSTFFEEEFVRAFANAKNSENPSEILECLRDVSYVEEKNVPSRVDIIKLLEGYLTSERDALRYWAIWLMADWIVEDKQKSHTKIVAKMIDRLEDENWKIRHITKMLLEEMNALPPGYKVRLLDKLRVMVSSPYEIK